MKAVLISIQPKWCELIANGKKTIEVRKTRPKIETSFKCYIYCTKDELLTRSHLYGKIYVASSRKYQSALEKNGNITLSGNVIGEFVCDSIEDFSKWQNAYPSLLIHINLYAGTNSDYKFLDGYLRGHKTGYGWHISDLKIYDKPKELSEFSKYGFEETVSLKRPPQSWMYVEDGIYQ